MGALSRLVLLGAFGLGIGCSVPTTDEGLGQASSPIINGSADTAKNDSVVLIAIRKDGQLQGDCTGTMVAPNLVLTARHCVTETDEGALCRVDGTPYEGGGLGADFTASDLFIYTGTKAIQLQDSAASAAARGKQLFFESTSTYCDKDVAFILLDRSLSVPVSPIRLKEGAREGESLTAVGWGLTEEGRQPDVRMMRSGILVEAVGPFALDSDTQIGLSRSEFLVGESTCSGDSGGPAFASTGAVVGVVSRGGGGREDPGNRASKCIGSRVLGIYTHLATKKTLVDRAFKASGYGPRDEGTPPSKISGSICKTNVECSSNTCSGGKCLTRCEDAKGCADGEVCVPKPDVNKKDVKVCFTAPEETPAEEEEAPEEEAPAPTVTTKKTTKEGCSAAPGTTSVPTTGILLAIAAVVAAKRRRRREG